MTVATVLSCSARSPSTGMPYMRWKSSTARRVYGPKTPSGRTTCLPITWLRQSWSSLTCSGSVIAPCGRSASSAVVEAVCSAWASSSERKDSRSSAVACGVSCPPPPSSAAAASPPPVMARSPEIAELRPRSRSPEREVRSEREIEHEKETSVGHSSCDEVSCSPPLTEPRLDWREATHSRCWARAALSSASRAPSASTQMLWRRSTLSSVILPRASRLDAVTTAIATLSLVRWRALELRSMPCCGV
mmetsp:Transcript_2847/g.7125  ORF Transcript_2847/g.7125 Transcript_2847/m.7125 type:complete len:247 (+) Transcript_2847:236-976(+)